MLENFELREASGQLLADIAELAEEIWHEHYELILGLDQVNYMVEHFQSLPAMKRQIDQEGYRYRGIFLNGRLCGYAAVVLHPDFLFLSKLYLHHSARGKGLSTQVLNILKGEAKACGSKIQLTVNRFNADSIAVYQKAGFQILRTEKNPIGGGYFMDDYIMELDCSAA